MTTNRDDGAEHGAEFRYDTTPPTPKRTVDRPPEERAPTPDAAAKIRELLNPIGEGTGARRSLEAPHAGDAFTQRQLARKVFAGRSYQAVQAWVNGEPVPKATEEWLLADLVRVDNQARDRTIRVAEDEIAIVVKR